MDSFAALIGLLFAISLGVAGWTIVYVAIIRPIFFSEQRLYAIFKINLYIWIIIIAFFIGYAYTYK